MARFYDWSSDLGDCVSVSQLYQNLGRNKATTASPSSSVTGSDYSNRSSKLHPLTGRMFVKDKTPSLTKGEREIIDGIYRNRSDVVKTGPTVSSEDAAILRHSDAWVLGRRSQQAKLKYTHANMYLDLAQERQNLCVDPRPNSRSTSCSLCQNCSKQTEDPPLLVEDKASFEVTEEGPTAPPSTPEKLLNRREKVPPINNGCGAVYVERMEDSKDTETTENKHKTFLNIFLPKVHSEEHLDDEDSNSHLPGQWSQHLSHPAPSLQTDKKVRRPKRPSTASGIRNDKPRQNSQRKDNFSRLY